MHVVYAAAQLHSNTALHSMLLQCLQHAVSLIRNFNPKFQYLWSVYPYRILCFVLYKIAANTHAALANFFRIFNFVLRISSYNFVKIRMNPHTAVAQYRTSLRLAPQCPAFGLVSSIFCAELFHVWTLDVV